ncbi:MAG: lipid-A-disaccharide synthase N-terminal domain-containing protein [Paraprevotella sp.]|nr:lipid-A-disaccharide synthase N-terminal domain-containing protein [Paraprevotella sp.]
MSPYVVLSIGFLAQVFFSARILVQWILSERAGKVLSPSLFWILSLAGAYLLCLYGWLRNDFSIVLGQFISYYVYLWNLKEKGIWKSIFMSLKWILLLTPVVAILFVCRNAEAFMRDFLRNDSIPLWLVIFGSSGQILFTLRFLYQFYYSRRRGQSVLPAGFWILSLTGSLLIVIYGCIRLDAVLIVGQSVGFVAYIRNLYIGCRDKKIEHGKDERI